jgi:hypothetical protein
VLDSSNHLCRWVSSSSNNNNNNVNDGGYLCEPEPINMTIKTLVIISIYVSMFTAFINLIVDFLFEDILFAPTMDSTKEEKAKDRILSMLQESKRKPVENNNKNKVDEESKKEVEKEEETRPGSSANQNPRERRSHAPLQPRSTLLVKMQSGKFDLETTRVVPSSTQEAHELAVISMKEIMQDQLSDIKKYTTSQEIRHKASLHLKQKSSLEKYRESLKSRGESWKVKSGVHRSVEEMALDEKFVELTVDIMEQRKALKRSQQDGFDEMWGIDPTGEFSKQRQNYLLFWSQPKSSGDIIKKELEFVEKESKLKSHKLEYASSVQTGLEILHYFILDLLGRDTPVARIFLTKTEEE